MTTAADVFRTVTAHHARMQTQPAAHVDAGVAAAGDGRPEAATVAELKAMPDRHVVSHARAEEDVPYAAATAPDRRLLVAAWCSSNETLLGRSASCSPDTSGVRRSCCCRRSWRTRRPT